MPGDVGTLRELSASEIAQQFIETAQKVDKCFGFEVTKWLERYQELRKQPNFPEAAMLIISAAQIYGRKVDYLEEMVYNIVRESVSQNAEKSDKRGADDVETGKRKRVKRFRPETLCEKFHCAEYIVKDFKSLPVATLCEKIVQKTRQKGGRSFEEEFTTWTVRKDAKGGKKHARRRLEMEEEEMCSRYTSFGESHIFDYDGEDIVGRRRDFKVFSGHIDAENQAVGNDINLKKHYKGSKSMEMTSREANQLEDCSLMQPVTVEVPEIEPPISEDLGKNLLQEVPEMPPSPNNLPSDDEGIGMSQTFSNTIQISDLSPSDWRILSPNVELMDIMEHLKKDPPKEFTISSSVKNLLCIDSAYLKHSEDFTLPLKMFERRSVVEMNILKLPEKKLRSKCLFALPKEWIAERREAERSCPAVPGERRLFKLDMSLQSIPTPPPTPDPEESEEFKGFDESEIMDITLSNSKILSSTLTQEKSSPISPHKHPRMSADSGIQSPSHTMDIMDAILEESSSQIFTNASDSGFGSLLRSMDEGETSQKSVASDDILLNDTQAPDETIELSDHQRNLQKIASEEHRQRVEDMKQMTDKVNRWHEYLKPILRVSHARGHFDIHAYGTEILDAVNPKRNASLPDGQSLSLESVMAMKEGPKLLPRYFLSMLQLINTKNISIQVKNDVNKVIDLRDIHIKFLSAERHHEELQQGLQIGDKRKRSASNEGKSAEELKKNRK
ncbi:uncharacterized protein LOC132262385 [Phlebotomus argentipes]|uniref:uncharacterized protein LOC132262385 n=1 Tax=Phlebotomus argentipes TaxID=94469 RepID=UPI002893615B|nr:uncharacterized protein LOC132262385 [Phlebotomus argentipes]